MIIKPFENEYDVEIYNYIKENKKYEKLSEGEKAILYDIAHEVRKFIHFDWSTIDIPNFVSNCYKGYSKNKGAITLQVIANCINVCFPNKLAVLEGAYESKRLVITDKYFRKRGNNDV